MNSILILFIYTSGLLRDFREGIKSLQGRGAISIFTFYCPVFFNLTYVCPTVSLQVSEAIPKASMEGE